MTGNANLRSTLLRLAGVLLLLFLVAPLPTIERVLFSTWSRSSQNGAPYFEFVGQPATGKGGGREAVQNIGHFVFKYSVDGGKNGGEEVGKQYISMDEVVAQILGLGFVGGRIQQNPRHLQNLLGGGGVMGIHSVHEFTLLLPWVLALILGAFVPAVIAVIEHCRVRRYRNYYSKMDRKEKRLLRLILCFKRFKKTVEESDLSSDCADDTDKPGGIERSIHGDDDIKPDTCNDCDTKSSDCLLVPPPGTPLLKKEEREDIGGDLILREVSASCAICLDRYMKNDVVVWSSNEDCQHVFHEWCIVSWLAKKRNARCPCCRQQFIDDILRVQAGLKIS